jgi:hypothetical protein
MTTPNFPPDLAAFAALLASQPAQARDAFNYCLCLMMVEGGRMDLVPTMPGEAGQICLFKSANGEPFAVQRPPMSAEEEANVIEVLREILKDEGMF